jgi:hypothetical protein
MRVQAELLGQMLGCRLELAVQRLLRQCALGFSPGFEIFADRTPKDLGDADTLGLCSSRDLCSKLVVQAERLDCGLTDAQRRATALATPVVPIETAGSAFPADVPVRIAVTAFVPGSSGPRQPE